GITEVITDEAYKQEMSALLAIALRDILERPVFEVCTDAATEAETPCYIDSSVLFLASIASDGAGPALMARYVEPVTETYLELASRLTSEDEYARGLEAYKELVYGSYVDALFNLNRTSICSTKQEVDRQLAELADHNRIGAGVTEFLPFV